MLNRRIRKQTAALWTIGIFTVLALVLIWPIRYFNEDIAFDGGEVIAESELVDYDHDAGFYFTAQYDHLQTVTVHVTSVESGSYLLVQLFHKDKYDVFQCDAYEYAPLVDDSQRDTVFHNITKSGGISVADWETIPGWTGEGPTGTKSDEDISVTVPLDVNLTPGEQYVLIVRGENSSFRVGMTDLVSTLETGNSPSYLNGFWQDTSLENGQTVCTDFVYRVPLRKSGSIFLALIVLFATTAAVLLVLIICRLKYGRGGGTRLSRRAAHE